MLQISQLHHVAIITNHYQKTKNFYCNVLGFKLDKEVYREDRKSYKADLSLNGKYLIELFTFENAPPRVTQPEAAGLRHIAFAVKDLNECIETLKDKNIPSEPIRTDEYTNKRFTFITDPDNLPIELYEEVEVWMVNGELSIVNNENPTRNCMTQNPKLVPPSGVKRLLNFFPLHSPS